MRAALRAASRMKSPFRSPDAPSMGGPLGPCRETETLSSWTASTSWQSPRGYLFRTTYLEDFHPRHRHKRAGSVRYGVISRQLTESKQTPTK